MTLVVDRRGASLELAARNVIVLREPDQAPTRIGVRALSSVLLHGEVSLSTGVLRALAENGVSLVTLPVRGARSAAGFTIPSLRLPLLRHAQHRACADPPRRLEIARRCVLAKIEAQRATLSACGCTAESATYVGEVAAASTIPALMGCEGASAREYFHAWGAAWRSPWRFIGRNRQPPRDPVNAMMSLGYTLALSGVERQLGRLGLDLQIGFLHGIARDRHSLALDVLEASRPAVDLWIWTLCREGAIVPEQFTDSPQEGCRLDKDGRQSFYRDWFARGLDVAERPARHLIAGIVRELRRSMQE